MSNQPDPLAALRALREATSDLTQRAALDAAIRVMQSQRQAPLVDLHGAQTGEASIGDVAGGDLVKAGGDLAQGSVTVSDDARINGVVVGANLGKIIFGRDPEEDERRRLVWYLERLANKLVRLPLRGIDEQLGRGDGISMPRVYVSLATIEEVDQASGRSKELRRFYEDGTLSGALKPAYDPNYAGPDQAIVRVVEQLAPGKRSPVRVLLRARLATEAAATSRCLVLLGDPGSGKSTFLNHLAWALARRGLGYDDAPRLLGWSEAPQQLPIKLSLRALAGWLERHGASDRSVSVMLRETVEAYDVPEAGEMLSAALNRGAVILLFDGLDEVPLQRLPGQVADRLTTLRAVRAFCELHGQARALLTCRSRAFSPDLRAELGWPVATLAPLTMGQVRSFVGAWYGELAVKGQLTKDQAVQLIAQLVAAIEDPARPRLRAMAETPLLLTLMAVVLYNKNELPRDRPMLYQRILELLLGQWDMVRDGQSMAQALAIADWTSDRILPLLSELSYQAHAAASSADGRGSLPRAAVHEALLRFFTAERVADPWSTAGRCLDYMNHRSGLLIPDDEQDSYIFAHLTLQEHCAGRHLLISADPVGAVLRHRADDRWREPILLGLGVVQQANPFLVEAILRSLLDRNEDAAKASARRYRDLILAAEIGKDRDWATLRRQPGVRVDELCGELRAGLAALLADPAQPLSVAERVRAGFLLGDLGDPRVPVTIEEWRREIARAQGGEAGGYFCRVEAKTYRIGSDDSDPDADEHEKPQHPFTVEQPFAIARYPITNAQWQTWVEQAGGQPSYAANDDDLNRPNQPVVAITWHMTNAFCVWLSAQLSSALPKGSMLRLPTEQEWEAAARGGDARRYPWGDDWREDCAATDEDRETRGWPWSVPVGCYPAGTAPCGALDMAGNVWEWTASVWQSYPGAEEVFTDKERRVLRGGAAWGNNRTKVRCGARDWYHPDINRFNFGFRVVLAPALAQMS